MAAKPGNWCVGKCSMSWADHHARPMKTWNRETWARDVGIWSTRPSHPDERLLSQAWDISRHVWPCLFSRRSCCNTNCNYPQMKRNLQKLLRGEPVPTHTRTASHHRLHRGQKLRQLDRGCYSTDIGRLSTISPDFMGCAASSPEKDQYGTQPPTTSTGRCAVQALEHVVCPSQGSTKSSVAQKHKL